MLDIENSYLLTITTQATIYVTVNVVNARTTSQYSTLGGGPSGVRVDGVITSDGRF